MKYIVMPAFNAAATLKATIESIPDRTNCHLLLCDDGSSDNTAEVARQLGIEVIKHPENRGYGANQKSLYRLMRERGAEVIVMLHPDNQYDGSAIPKMVELIDRNQADLILGNRMFDQAAKLGGMPWWKRWSNRILSSTQRLVYGVQLTEFHSGLRAYRHQILDHIDFMKFSDDFVFDSEIIAAAISHGYRLAEVPTQARYFNEASSINLKRSLAYGLASLKVLLRFRRGDYKPALTHYA